MENTWSILFVLVIVAIAKVSAQCAAAGKSSCGDSKKCATPGSVVCGPGTEPDNGKARAISCMGEGVVGGIARPCNYPWVELKGEGCIDRSFLCPAWADKGACKNYWYYSFMQSYCCNSCAAYFGYYTGIYARMRYDPQLYYKLLMAALKQQGGVTPGVGMGMMGQQGLYQGGMGMMVGQQGLYPGGMGIAGQQGLYQGGMGVLGQGGMYGRGLMMGLMKKKK